MKYAISPRALIRDASGRILFVRRSAGCTHWPGEWELPGGKPEAGEDVFHCLSREVMEETGLVIAPIRLVGAAEVDLSSIRVIYLVMEAKPMGGELLLSGENDEARWAAESEMETVRLIPPIAAVLKERGHS